MPVGVYTRKTVADRFLGKVDRSGGESACWPWTGGTYSNGYGLLHVAPKTILAHRYAFTVANGPIPPKMLVCHRCDNRKCCNPSHLFLGTHAENMADCVKKGRISKGSKHSDILRRRRPHTRRPETVLRGEMVGGSKLKSDDIRKIREMSKVGKTHKEIGALFDVSRTNVGLVVSGKSWGWVV